MEVDLEGLGLLASTATGHKGNLPAFDPSGNMAVQYQSSAEAAATAEEKKRAEGEAISSLLTYMAENGMSSQSLLPTPPPPPPLQADAQASGAALMDQMLRAHPPPPPLQPTPTQQTRSGRISRPPPAPPRPTPAMSLPPIPAGSAMIDTIAQVNRAILQNLMGGVKRPEKVPVGPFKRAPTPPLESIGFPGGQAITSFQIESTGPESSQRWANGSSYGGTQSDADEQYDSNPRKRQRTTGSPSGSDPGGSGGKKRVLVEGANGAKLSKEEKAAVRKEKNRRAAYESRQAKKQQEMQMMQRLEQLEEDYSMLQTKYHVLEQQHARLQAHYASAQAQPPPTVPQGFPDFPAYPISNPTAYQTPSITEGAINFNGIQMSLDQYLAYTSGLASGMASAAGAAGTSNQASTSMSAQAADATMGMANFYDTFAGELLAEEDEEEDGEFLPSSPAYQDETPMQGDVDMDGDEADAGEGSQRTIREGEDRQTEGDENGYSDGQEGDFEEEEREDNGTDYDSDDDVDFDDEELEDDEGLFLPIEDVPIPQGEQEAMDAANAHPPQAIASAAPIAPGIDLGLGVDATLSLASVLAAAGLPIYTIPGLTSSIPGLGSSSAWNSSGAAVGVDSAESVGLAAGQSMSAWSGAGDAAVADAAVSTPDRGFGLGRGVTQEQDPMTLIRQVYILNQSQQRAAK